MLNTCRPLPLLIQPQLHPERMQRCLPRDPSLPPRYRQVLKRLDNLQQHCLRPSSAACHCSSSTARDAACSVVWCSDTQHARLRMLTERRALLQELLHFCFFKSATSHNHRFAAGKYIIRQTRTTPYTSHFCRATYMRLRTLLAQSAAPAPSLLHSAGSSAQTLS